MKRDTDKLAAVAIKQAVKEIRAHFRARNENGGWPLRVDFYISDITHDILGFDLFARVLMEINKAVGIQVDCSGDNFVMTLDKKSTRKGMPSFIFGKKKSKKKTKKRKAAKRASR